MAAKVLVASSIFRASVGTLAIASSHQRRQAVSLARTGLLLSTSREAL
jgi:hypothetical protein